jgi:hypothetical protein
MINRHLAYMDLKMMITQEQVVVVVVSPVGLNNWILALHNAKHFTELV